MSTIADLNPASSLGCDDTLPPLILTRDIHPRVTFEEMVRLCALNDHLNFEWDPDGTLYIMSPTGAGPGHKSFLLASRLANWADAGGTGIGFDSSAGFTLPDGKVRSPDVAWIRLERWQALTKAQQDTFAPIAPDFLVELRSPTDSLADLRAKMELYRANGVRLGWLIDPVDHAVEIYRPGHEPQRLDNPRTLDGGDVLPGFTLDLKNILFD